MRSDAHWVPVRRRRQENPRLQEVRRRSLMAQATQEAPRLKQRYESDVRPQLQRELGLSNVIEVPRLEKIVLNCGVGLATQQQSLLDGAVTDLSVITGQKPLVTRAKKSIAGCDIRDGNLIGAKVTFR